MRNKNSYWRTYSYAIKDVNSILGISPILFKQIFNAFKAVIISLNEVRQITLVRLLIKIKYSDGTYITLGDLINFDISNSGFKAVLIKLIDDLKNKSGLDNYTSKTPVAVHFSYHLEHDPNLVVNKTTIIKNISNQKNALDKVQIKGRNVPISKNLKHFGTLLETSGNQHTIQKSKTKDELYVITVHSDHHHVALFFKQTLIFEFRDYFDVNSNDLTFIRVYKNKKFLYENGKVLLSTNVIPTRVFSPKKLATKLAVKKFFTLDIETLTVDSVLTPICIALASKSEQWSYYLTDHNNNQDQMFLYAINSLVKTSNNRAIVYVHNLIRFDGVFLIKWLFKITDFTIKPIMKNGLLFEIQLIWINQSGKRIKLYFRDSYLLLPKALRDLAIAFNVSLKGWFPFRFLNELGMNGLLYEGIVPDMTYYDNITELEYKNILNSYKNTAWSLRDAIKLHSENDCRVLWDVMDAFNKHMFNLVTLNIFKALTLPTLSMNIYKSNFMGDNVIPVITGIPYDFIKQSYRGGHTDVYVPQAGKCYVYDINSLFSTVMKQFKYPVGKMVHFKGNILLDSKYADSVGFIKCRITATNNLQRPVLTTKINTPNGFRTIAPLGTWIDVITLDEYRAYKLLNYKFDIFEGIVFDSADLFSPYVDFWYNIKKNSIRGTVMFMLSKLFQNSLYGRFGLPPFLPTNVILTNEELELLFKNKPNVNITNVVDLEDGKTLVQINEEHNPDEASANVNIAIAASVTANARIFMSKILVDPAAYFNLPGLIIYYTNTDSIVTNMPLPAEFVGNELGQFKLEHVFEEAVFLAPKVYGGLVWNEETQSMTEIIKAKGYKGTLTYAELKSLLVKGSALELNHEIWLRSYEAGNITIKDSLYTLSITSNKRKNIYVNNIFTNTEPFIINNDKITNMD
jgi:DNA polymerase type B, organellar and viral